MNATVVMVSPFRWYLCYHCSYSYYTGLTMADRMYDPRPYDDRYTRRPDDRDRTRDRYRDRYDDTRYDDRRYDDRRSRYDDRRY